MKIPKRQHRIASDRMKAGDYLRRYWNFTPYSTDIFNMRRNGSKVQIKLSCA